MSDIADVFFSLRGQFSRREWAKVDLKCVHLVANVRDVVQSFGKIRYLVSVQDSLTPLPPSFYLVRIFPNYLRFKHHR